MGLCQISNQFRVLDAYWIIYVISISWNLCFDETFLQMKTGCVALVLCLNIGVDPPDIIKISPCARIECWIGRVDPEHLDKISMYWLVVFISVVTFWKL